MGKTIAPQSAPTMGEWSDCGARCGSDWEGHEDVVITSRKQQGSGLSKTFHCGFVNDLMVKCSRDSDCVFHLSVMVFSCN